MTKESLRIFEKEFNKSNRTTGDFIKSTKLAGIKLDDFGDPIQIDSGHTWIIENLGEIRQCKDCKGIEFIEIGQQPKNTCD